MDWVASIRQAIDYMEEHLLDIKNADELTEEVYMSSFYLQKGFKILTGYTVAEYIRNRRLYLSALDVIADKEKLIDIAYKYGYETPESFTKAFSRFHGMPPIQLRKSPSKMNIFLPLKISIKIQGGNDMDFSVERMKAFKVIGFVREFPFDSSISYQEIPKFWDETIDKWLKPFWEGKKPENEIEEAVNHCGIGEFGLCYTNEKKNGTFNYMIGGTYTEGKIPAGMEVYEFPELDWAKFPCTMTTLQAVNTKIFQEWLPGNPEYEIAVDANIEWYGCDDEAAIWVPIIKK